MVTLSFVSLSKQANTQSGFTFSKLHWDHKKKNDPLIFKNIHQTLISNLFYVQTRLYINLCIVIILIGDTRLLKPAYFCIMYRWLSRKGSMTHFANGVRKKLFFFESEIRSNWFVNFWSLAAGEKIKLGYSCPYMLLLIFFLAGQHSKQNAELEFFAVGILYQIPEATSEIVTLYSPYTTLTITSGLQKIHMTYKK